MSEVREKVLLVGDNPFHGISHLSQERSRVRNGNSTMAEQAANLVMISHENGADGFMFSVSDLTLSILRKINESRRDVSLDLYPIVPYVYEYVKLATRSGGIPGLAKKLAKELVTSGNLKAIVYGLDAAARADVRSLSKAYLAYEISRTRASAGKRAKLRSMLLHQTVTDMALALDMGWFFQTYIDFMSNQGITPGFNTGNFANLVEKFEAWGLGPDRVVIAAPFNKVGFQMNPSRTECEKLLSGMKNSMVIAISILAAGYLNPSEAMDYITTLPNLKGVAVGVSKEKQARETFRLLEDRFGMKHKSLCASRQDILLC
jgi:hypothetical protein